MIKSITEALARKRSELGQKEKGFTLIELLVVVIIIGILAAIAIPIFLNQQDQAKDSAVKSDLASAKVIAVSWLVDNPATPTEANLIAEGFTRSADTTGFAITAVGTNGFCIEETSAAAHVFSITSNGGVSLEGVGC